METRDYEQFGHFLLRKHVFDIVYKETNKESEAVKFSNLCFNVHYLKNKYSSTLMVKIKDYIDRAIRRINDSQSTQNR